MRSSRVSRWIIGSTALFAFIAISVVAGFHFATQALKGKVEAALGPHGAVGEIKVSLSAIEIVDLRIKAAPGWPAPEELSAKRVVIRPDLRALLDKNIRIASISVEDAYLSMLRQKDGKLLILPSLLSAQAKPAEQPAESGSSGASEHKPGEIPEIQIGAITLSHSAVEFFDASVRQPAVKIRLEDTNARIGKLQLPALTGRTPITLSAVVKGVKHDGRLTVDGGMEIASKDSDLKARLRQVDLLAFQPYLIKTAETGVQRGAMDLDLDSTVKANRLRAPGKLVLSDLELTSGSTFIGLPRTAVIGLMKDKKGQIAVDFVLEGNISDPKFSLNDNFASHIGTSVAGALGISLEGLAKGLGSAGGGAAKGVSNAIGKLFGKK